MSRLMWINVEFLKNGKAPKSYMTNSQWNSFEKAYADSY